VWESLFGKSWETTKENMGLFIMIYHCLMIDYHPLNHEKIYMLTIINMKNDHLMI